MRRLRVLAGLPLAILAATASAQRSDPPPQPSEEPALAILNEGSSARSDAERLVFIDRALAMLLQPTPFRGAVLCTRGALLERMDRQQEARAAFDQCRQLRPDDPRVLMAIALNDAQDKRPSDSARLIMRAVTIDPHAADQVDPSSMDTVVRQLRYARQDALANDLLSRLATTGYARLNPAAFSDAAFVAVLSRVQQGNVEGAVQMLPSVIAPEPGLKMLIDRQFAPIWPSVEQWAGTDLSIQRKALLDGARSTYEATPTPASRVAYAVALVDTGHRQQGIAVLEERQQRRPQSRDPATPFARLCRRRGDARPQYTRDGRARDTGGCRILRRLACMCGRGCWQTRVGPDRIKARENRLCQRRRRGDARPRLCWLIG